MTVTHTALLFSGDSSFWDKRGDESQLLFERCGQPHSLHKNQDQRAQWRPVHHPSCRGWGHIRCVLPVANRLFIFWTRLKIPLDCNQNIGPNWVFFSYPVFFSCKPIWVLCSSWNILLYRDAWLWYPAITRYKVLKYNMHVLYFGQIFIDSIQLPCTVLQIAPKSWIYIF